MPVFLALGEYGFRLQTTWPGHTLFILAIVFSAVMAATALFATLLSRLRNQNVEALRLSERDYHNLFEQAHDAIIVFHPEREIVLDVNERACEIYGFSRTEFVGMSLEAISKNVPRGKDMIEGTLRRGDYLNFETVQYRKDGTEMFLELNASVVTYKGQPAILSINREVTERVRAELALRQAEEKYRGIFENAVEGIFQSTPDGRFISVNPAMARIFGFDSPEQMLTEYTDIERQLYVDPSRRAEMRRMVEEYGVVLGFVSEGFRKDGSTVWTSTNTRVVRDSDGAICYYEGFLEDITDRVRADEEERRRKRLMALRADVIADFAQPNTSLNDILRLSTEAMVRHLDAALARIWILNQEEGLLELRASAGLSTSLDGPLARVPVGDYKVGRVAEERTPHLTNDVQHDERFFEKELVRREGIVGFAGHPLLIEDRLVGVAAMFSRHPLQGDTLEALSFIAHTIAQGVERVRAEAALRDSEKRFRQLIQDLHVGLLMLSPRAEIILSNDAAVRMLGLTAAQLLGKTSLDQDWDVIHADGTPFPAETRPNLRAIATRSPVRNVVMGVYRKATQDRVWLLVDTEPHLADDGSVRHVLCTFSDITEHRRAEEALRQSEVRNRAILKAIPDMMFLLNRGGVYLDYHAKDEGDLLVPPESFIGKNMNEVLPPEMADKLLDCFERAAESGETQMFEYVLSIDGQQRRYEARVVSCDDDKILTVVRDVTAYKLAETQRNQLLRRLVNAQEEERSRLAREVHDEFAAYLSALKWGLESLKRTGGLPAPAGNDLSYLLGLTTQLQHKVRDFAFDLSPAELDNKAGLPAALDLYVRRWSERSGGGVAAEYSCVGFDSSDARLPRDVETAIYRVAQEALTNVLKHADARRVSLSLGFYVLEPGRGEVRLTVEDDGVGFVMPQDEGMGRGLGLKGMGERMTLIGGKLDVLSNNQGTTLSASVPVSFPR
jgi:PAS domain S-box-containing protein